MTAARKAEERARRAVPLPGKWRTRGGVGKAASGAKAYPWKALARGSPPAAGRLKLPPPNGYFLLLSFDSSAMVALSS